MVIYIDINFLQWKKNLPVFPFPGNDNSANAQRQSGGASSEDTPRSTRTPSGRTRNVPPMRISRRLRRVDVSNDTQFENMSFYG